MLLLIWYYNFTWLIYKKKNKEELNFINYLKIKSKTIDNEHIYLYMK